MTIITPSPFDSQNAVPAADAEVAAQHTHLEPAKLQRAGAALVNAVPMPVRDLSDPRSGEGIPEIHQGFPEFGILPTPVEPSPLSFTPNHPDPSERQ